VGVVSLDAAREQLGVPADTDVDDFDFTAEPDRARLLGVAVLGLPYLNAAFEDVPFRSALDTGQVHAAAATSAFDRERGAAVVRTDQSFDDLASALADAGYEPTEDLLVSEASPSDVLYPVVADGGEGTIILARSETAVRRVLDGDVGPTPAIELLEQLPGVAAAAGADPGGLACGNGFGVGVDLEPAPGEIVIFAGDDPDPDQAIPDPESTPDLRPVDLGDRQAQGPYVRVEFEYSTDLPLQSPARLVSSELLAGGILDSRWPRQTRSAHASALTSGARPSQNAGCVRKGCGVASGR
jgi:hypothetical protein